MVHDPADEFPVTGFPHVRSDFGGQAFDPEGDPGEPGLFHGFGKRFPHLVHGYFEYSVAVHLNAVKVILHCLNIGRPLRRPGRNGKLLTE